MIARLKGQWFDRQILTYGAFFIAGATVMFVLGLLAILIFEGWPC